MISFILFLVSSQAIRSTLLRVYTTLGVISLRFPIGVAHKYNIPDIYPLLFPIIKGQKRVIRVIGITHSISVTKVAIVTSKTFDKVSP